MSEELRPLPDTDQNEDLAVTGKHKSHKKKSKSLLYPAVITLLIGVMAYSGYQIASTLIRNAKADDVYSDIENQFVVELPDDELPPEETEPEQTEASAESSLEPQDTRATEDVPAPSTEEADPATAEGTEETEETPAPSTAAPTTKAATTKATTAPQDPMRLLSVDFTSLKKANKDVVAWIQGLGGVVNYPVVQCKNNSYYLKHLFDGTANPNGTIFVHCENRFLQDDVTFIFGHHMRSGKMFGRLTDYESSSVFRKYPEFRLYTPGKTYTLKVFAVMRGTGTEQITLNYASADAFNRAMQAYAKRSMYSTGVSVSYGDKIVCLCTCSRHIDDGRFFIYCKVVK